MINATTLDELAQRLAAIVPPGMKDASEDLGRNFRAPTASSGRSRAKELGFASFTEDVKLADGQTRTRVKVGPFSSRTAAEAAQRKLEAAGMRSMIAPRS